uniref:Uncharacterized protein n=1 Tax=Anguilla anguilla TaxID=7936 RepID=A0A0E9XPM5_ANGAN
MPRKAWITIGSSYLTMYR